MSFIVVYDTYCDGIIPDTVTFLWHTWYCDPLCDLCTRGYCDIPVTYLVLWHFLWHVHTWYCDTSCDMYIPGTVTLPVTCTYLVLWHFLWHVHTWYCETSCDLSPPCLPIMLSWTISRNLVKNCFMVKTMCSIRFLLYRQTNCKPHQLDFDQDKLTRDAIAPGIFLPRAMSHKNTNRYMARRSGRF